MTKLDLVKIDKERLSRILSLHEISERDYYPKAPDKTISLGDIIKDPKKLLTLPALSVLSSIILRYNPRLARSPFIIYDRITGRILQFNNKEDILHNIAISNLTSKFIKAGVEKKGFKLYATIPVIAEETGVGLEVVSDLALDRPIDKITYADLVAVVDWISNGLKPDFAVQFLYNHPSGPKLEYVNENLSQGNPDYVPEVLTFEEGKWYSSLDLEFLLRHSSPTTANSRLKELNAEKKTFSEHNNPKKIITRYRLTRKQFELLSIIPEGQENLETITYSEDEPARYLTAREINIEFGIEKSAVDGLMRRLLPKEGIKKQENYKGSGHSPWLYKITEKVITDVLGREVPAGFFNES